MTLPSTVVATGSIAFDYIIRFQGHFADHFVATKAQTLNLSFLVDRMEKRHGGVAANYAYTMALLGQPAAILATAGEDAADYRSWLEGLGVDCRGLRLLPGELSATGFTTVDLDANQLTGYYGGAMIRASEVHLEDTVPDPAAVIIGPNAPDAMEQLVRECREARVPWVYDPSHQLPHLDAATLVDSARGAWILIGNEYEMGLIEQRTERDLEGLLELAEIVVTTLGSEGAQIATRERTVHVPAAPISVEQDPVGAGDAFRGGLVHGLLTGRSLEEAGRIAALAGAYVVEQAGASTHHYTREEFESRYRQAFEVALS
ncbi:MAG: carbohydrate kinase family protein [Candidatus Dormibacteraeota bacterium]|nr:carbohydrate kinase family protein [Candidatus Dormibacteraeota bacterium]